MLHKLPKEMYAEIARFIGGDFPGKGFRRAAGAVQIRDTINNRTYLNGVLHSFDDQPAIINDSGRYWFKNGLRHRDNDQPAVISTNGEQYWYQYGERHRDNDLPAVVFRHKWFPYGQLHREWYQHDQLHRDNDLPAIITNGNCEWYRRGKRHRGNDLAAVIYAFGDSEWWINGECIRDTYDRYPIDKSTYRLINNL